MWDDHLCDKVSVSSEGQCTPYRLCVTVNILQWSEDEALTDYTVVNKVFIIIIIPLFLIKNLIVHSFTNNKMDTQWFPL